MLNASDRSFKMGTKIWSLDLSGRAKLAILVKLGWCQENGESRLAIVRVDNSKAVVTKMPKGSWQGK